MFAENYQITVENSRTQDIVIMYRGENEDTRQRTSVWIKYGRNSNFLNNSNKEKGLEHRGLCLNQHSLQFEFFNNIAPYPDIYRFS